MAGRPERRAVGGDADERDKLRAPFAEGDQLDREPRPLQQAGQPLRTDPLAARRIDVLKRPRSYVSAIADCIG
jgi:hypothetical protein